MLSMTRVTDSYGCNGRPPVSHKLLGSGIKDWFTADDLRTRSINLTTYKLTESVENCGAH